MSRISRRTILSTGAALAVTPAAAADEAPAKKAAAKKSKKATFVLVHGGGHGGWCWKRVAEPLMSAGHTVYAPSLTGMADRSHLLNPSIDLDTQITDIVNLLKWEDLKNVILVGHSYGGMVITGIADRALDHIGHMVYYDAQHPKNGTSLWGPSSGMAGGGAAAAAGGAAAGGGAAAAGAAAAGGAAAGGAGAGGGGRGGPTQMIRQVNGVDLMLFPDEALIKGALGVTKPEDVAWLMEKLTPHPAKCFFQPLKMDNEEAVHKLPTTDIWRKMILENQQKSGREFTWAQRLWAIDSPSHDLMVTDPQPSVEMLLKIAAMTV